jgi:hypothetical protein
MAESDYLSEGNVYTTFSKGPKSIYRWRDEVNLPTVVLNVPQTDEDDEWGRTQRIGDERLLDYVAKIYYTLFDNQGSICGIVLEPGEAGADINVAKNMIRLIGRSSTSDTGVFDLSVPSLTLGNTIIDGSADTISIGTSTQLASDSLTIDSNVIFSSTTSTSTYQFKDKNIVRFTNNGTDPAYTEIIINGKSYRFDENGLTLPTGATISGTINSNNIVPIANNTYDIGTSSLRYATIYGVNANFTGTVTAAAFSGASFGAQFSAISICGSSISFLEEGGSSLIFDDSDLIPGVDNSSSLGSASKRFSYIYSTGGNFTGTLTTMDIVPVTNSLYDIGASGNRYNNVYADVGTFTDYLYITHICSSGSISTYGDSFNIFNGISNVAVFSETYHRSYVNILPDADNTIDIGSISLRFADIYGITIHATNFTGSNFGALGVDVILCGSSVTLYDNDSSNSLYFKDSVFRPDTDDYVDLGATTFNWNNLYVRRAYIDTTLTANYIQSGNIGDDDIPVTICGGSHVTLYAVDSGNIVRIDGDGFRPGNSGTVSIGSSSTPFKEIWLEDEYTGSPIRIYVCDGILYP